MNQHRITIEEIESKEFTVKPRGYDPEEVDLMLDDICDVMEEQQNEIAKLEKQLSETKNRGVQPSLRPSADTAELNRLQGMVKNLQSQLNESQSALQNAQTALRNAEQAKNSAEQALTASAAREKELTEKMANQAPAAVPAPAASPTDSFREILEMAQRVKEETIAEAQKKAEEILNEARGKIDSGVVELSEQKDALEKQVENLRKTAADYRERFAEMIRVQTEALKGIEDM